MELNGTEWNGYMNRIECGFEEKRFLREEKL